MKKYIHIALLLLKACSVKKTIMPTATLEPPAIISTSLPPSPTSTRSSTLIASARPLSTAEFLQMLFSLSIDSTNCRLPCLWGLHPGKGVNELNDFMGMIPQSANDSGEIFDSNNYLLVSNYGQLGGFTAINQDGGLLTHFAFSFYKNADLTNLDALALHVFARNLISKNDDWSFLTEEPAYGAETFLDSFKEFSISNMLKVYGSPTQILVATFRDSPSRPDIDWHPFSLVLHYPEQGFFIEYVSPRETDIDLYSGCPSKGEIYLVVWDIGAGSEFQDVVQKGGGIINEQNIGYFKSINKATNLSPERFQERFLDPQNELCIETPREIWVEQ